MNSNIDEFLDHVDQWKFKLHERLKRMTPAQCNASWTKTLEQARARGLPVSRTGETIEAVHET